MGRNVGIPPLASSFHLIHCTAHRPSPLPPARLSVHPLLPRRRMPPPPPSPSFSHPPPSPPRNNLQPPCDAQPQAPAASASYAARMRLNPHLSLRLFDHMLRPGADPDPVAYALALASCARRRGPRRGRAAPRTRREADRVTFVSVISAIAHLGAPALRRVSGLMLMLSRKGLRSRRS
jgi:hypothetical protein